jgi:hypothetical protein
VVSRCNAATTIIDRRTVLRGVLYGAAFITAGGVAVTTTPELAEAIPLAADKAGPIKTDDLFEDQDLIDRVQYWRLERSQIDAMARFFFHITNGIPFKDEVGEDYSSLEEAMAEAAKIATDLAEDRVYDRYAVLVTDEHGNEVARVPIGKADIYALGL